MPKPDLDRVIFHSKEDMAGGYNLSKGEPILRNSIEEPPTDINDLLELHNIKLYFDNEIHLKAWSENDIESFKKKVIHYGKMVGQFMSQIDDNNILQLHEILIFGYKESFWKLINDQKLFKKISSVKIEEILGQDPYLIRVLLKHKGLVVGYNNTLSQFLLSYPGSAEILLSIYEVQKDFNQEKLFLPKNLSLTDKEKIISDYIESESCNVNYLPIIQNSRKTNNFDISDKTRLKAKRKYQKEINQAFEGKSNDSLLNYGVSISYPENMTQIKEGKVENLVAHYEYSIDFIKKNSHPYLLFLNFKLLFEFLDNQNRINLISKTSQIGVMERVMGVKSQNEYFCSMAFRLSEMTSQAQVYTYTNLIKTLGNPLEDTLQHVFTSVFPEKYNFANNASLTVPTPNASPLEKVRSLAPELESVLKQYKLFVEDNQIDFELLQISSSPSSMKDIPSLNENKYLYLNTSNEEANACSNLFFSDQTLLAYVEPYKEKHYRNFFELLSKESDIVFNNYQEHQTPRLNYLKEKGYIIIDENGLIQLPNRNRVLILKDLYYNTTASFHHYPTEVQEEVIRMKDEDLIQFGSTLLSKAEQDYFNFHLNKSEFTNGQDLRNSYLHGTQANPSETDLHKHSYLTYLKLLTLILLKIEDDLLIWNTKKEANTM